MCVGVMQAENFCMYFRTAYGTRASVWDNVGDYSPTERTVFSMRHTSARGGGHFRSFQFESKDESC